MAVKGEVAVVAMATGQVAPVAPVMDPVGIGCWSATTSTTTTTVSCSTRCRWAVRKCWLADVLSL